MIIGRGTGICRVTQLKIWKIKGLFECLISVETPGVAWIHIYGEAAQHFVNLALQLVLVDAAAIVIHLLQIV